MSGNTMLALVGGTLMLAGGLLIGFVPEVQAPALAGADLAVRAVRATGFDWSIWVIAAGITVFVTGLALRWVHRTEDPARRVRRLAQRGASVAAIARATGLAQDAVRDCLRGELVPAAAPSAGSGTLFRRRERTPTAPPPDFAALLRESALRTRT